MPRVELSAEAIRLTREVHRRLPGRRRGGGAARADAADRRAPSGARPRATASLVPLAEQDRSLWDRAEIAEGVALVEESLASKPAGPYQLQAAIAAVHDEAPSAQETDWRQILAVYELLERVARESDGDAQPSRRGRDGARVRARDWGCWRRSTRDRCATTTVWQPCAPISSRWPATEVGARAAYERAARLTTSIPERRYLEARMAAL